MSVYASKTLNHRPSTLNPKQSSVDVQERGASILDTIEVLQRGAMKAVEMQGVQTLVRHHQVYMY